jgi:hypothetical protein
VEHTTESTERDISWLDRLIDAERRPGMQAEMKGMTQMEGEAR